MAWSIETAREHPREGVVYTSGRVLTGAERAEAMYVRDGRVVLTGSNEDVLAAAGRTVPRHDLQGATVVPGLVDTHPHLAHFAIFAAPLVDVLEARGHDDILEAVRRRAHDVPAGTWIVTTPIGEPHYFHRRSFRDLREGVLPDRHTLDKATSDHPVAIQAWAPVTPNVIALNSAALSVLGIDGSTPDRVSDVWIDKDHAGAPTGLLRGAVTSYYNDDPFFAELAAKMPALIQPESAPDAVVGAMRAHNALGFTSVYECHAMEFGLIELYHDLRRRGLQSLRVQASPELQGSALPGSRTKTPDEILETLRRAASSVATEDDWMRVKGITASTWGPCYTGQVHLREGYLDPFGNRTTGKRAISTESLRLAMEFCADNGLHLNLCSNSYDENDEYLALAAAAARRAGIDRMGWTLQHGKLIRKDQAERFADLGFDMSVSLSFTFGKGDMLAERMGREKLVHLTPLRDLLDAGLVLGASTDWGPANPFEQIRLAITHEMFPSGRSNAGRGQVVSREEAYRMWTSGGAHVLGWEGIGGLRPGDHADLAVIDRDPVTCDLDTLPSTRVLRTVVDGQVVHDDGSLT